MTHYQATPLDYQQVDLLERMAVSLERIAEALETLGVVLEAGTEVRVLASARHKARKESKQRLYDDRHGRLCPARLGLGLCNCGVGDG